jgi:hypothetical protein
MKDKYCKLRKSNAEIKMEVLSLRRTGLYIITLKYVYIYISCRDSSIDKATDDELDGSGSIRSLARIFPSPQYQDRLWDPPSLIFKGAGGDFQG